MLKAQANIANNPKLDWILLFFFFDHISGDEWNKREHGINGNIEVTVTANKNENEYY